MDTSARARVLAQSGHRVVALLELVRETLATTAPKAKRAIEELQKKVEVRKVLEREARCSR